MALSMLFRPELAKTTLAKPVLAMRWYSFKE